MILSRGFIEKSETPDFCIFFFDDTSNEKRRGTKMRPKKWLFPKMEKVIFLSGSQGESIRFRERE